MAIAEATILTENEQLAGINADYEQRFRISRARHRPLCGALSLVGIKHRHRSCSVGVPPRRA